MPSDAEGESKSPGGIFQRTVHETDDLVSVTVRKTEPNQKAGISLVERQGSVYVTKITENGLFHGAEVEVGDLVLSINGKRLGKGEGARDVIKHIGGAKAKVTMVVKKATRKARRGSRSLSPRSYRKRRGKMYKEAAHRNPDGSLKIDDDPRDLTPKEDDDFDQMPITAKKLFATQNAGVMFKGIDKMVFVSGISLDSIFHETELAVGDRIVSVNDMNFVNYADADYAKKLVQKSKSEVMLVVEKGHKNFNMKTDVDRGHNLEKEQPTQKPTFKPKLTAPKKRASVLDEDSSDVSISSADSDGSDDSDDALQQILSRGLSGGNEKERKSRAGKPISRMPKTKPTNTNTAASDMANEVSSQESPFNKKKNYAAKPATPTGTPSNSRKKLEHNDDSSESSLDERIGLGRSLSDHQVRKTPLRSFSATLSSSARFHASLNGSLKWDDYDGDYMKVTVRKKSMDESGIAMIKTEGKFILTKVPEHEKRISAGMQVLAINGVANLNTVTKADDLIDRSPVLVVLNIAFNEPVETNWKCPCCGKQMNSEGHHARQYASPKKQTNYVRGRAATRNDEESAVGSVVESVVESISESVSTVPVNNQAPPGQRLPKPATPTNRHLYNFDDFDSDSDPDEKEAERPRRPSISRYAPNDRFMVRVSKKSEHKNPGIKFFDFKGSIYVLEVSEDGPFFSTAIDKGDKVLSINGRKVSLIKSAANALNIIGEKRSVNLFALRSDPEDDEYKEALSHFPK